MLEELVDFVERAYGSCCTSHYRYKCKMSQSYENWTKLHTKPRIMYTRPINADLASYDDGTGWRARARSRRNHVTLLDGDSAGNCVVKSPFLRLISSEPPRSPLQRLALRAAGRIILRGLVRDPFFFRERTANRARGTISFNGPPRMTQLRLSPNAKGNSG